jgi:hypothetical protein
VVRHAQHNAVPSYRHDPVELGRFLLEHFVESSRRAVADRETLGENRFFDVYQQDLETRPVDTLEQIYEFLGLPLTDEVRGAMESWSAESRRGSRGEHNYSLEEFGYTADTVRHAFQEYLDHFDNLTHPAT